MTRRHAPRVVALAIALTIGALIVSAARAGGQAPNPAPFPASVPVRAVSGAVICRAAPMADGAYVSRHCEAHAPLYVDGVRAAYSCDPSRDLMHLSIAANPAVVMRPAVVGERLRWRSDFGAGDVTVTWTRGAVVSFAHGSGTRLSWGCSGTGLYGDDGALVAVLSDLYHGGDGGRIGRLIGGGEAVQVP